MPYLNSVPFFRGLPLAERYELTDCVPRELGVKAAAGEVVAGPLPLADYLRLESTFERLGPFGIAVRGRARSALLFSRKPVRQLDGATIAVTEQSSTTACLLRLLLEQRYELKSLQYRRGQPDEADALLLIGDEALQAHHTNTCYPFEIDVAFEWWLWQHLPFVFAVWGIRRDADADVKKEVEVGVIKALAMNTPRFAAIAEDYAKRLALPEAELQIYLSSFVYRLSQSEEEAIERFKALANEHHLL